MEDRQSLLDFNQAAAEVRTGRHAIKALFRGVEIEILESTSNPSLFQAVGGFRADANWRFRMSRDVQPPPREKEVVTQLATDRRFSITSVVVAPPDSAEILYHVVEAALP